IGRRSSPIYQSGGRIMESSGDRKKGWRERLVEEVRKLGDRPDTQRLVEEVRKLGDRPDTQRLVEEIRKLGEPKQDD
ncbi:MAG: hypothetical protein O7C01_00565, partial [Actinobacteria bacterium]|nr:hypothetical protein [Actinomycetota bacterium]